LNDWFLNDFLNFYNSLLEEWDLNNFFNFLDNLYILNDRSVSDNFYLFDTILDNNLFPNDWNFLRLSNNGIGLNNFLNNLWNLNNFLDSLNNRNWFLYDSINNLISHFNVIFNFLGISVLYLRNNLLDNLFNFNNLWNLNDFFNKFLDNYWNLDYLFYNLWFGVYNNFFDNRNLSNLYLDVIDNLLNFNNFFDFNYFFDNFLNSYYFRDLFNDFNDSFNDLWNFNDSLNDLFNGDDFLNNICNNYWHFERNVNCFLYLFDFLNFNDFFGDLINSDNLRNLYDSVNNFLYDLFDLNYFGDNSEDF